MICASIKEARLKKVINKLKRVPNEYDLVEIWLDRLRNVEESEIEKIIEIIDKPILFNIKGSKEKGKFKGSTKDKVEILKKCVKKGAAFVDISIEENPERIKELREICDKHSCKLILSYHNFKKTPSLNELNKVIEKARNLKADLIKIVPYAKKSSDNIICLELLFAENKIKKDLICFCMGNKGKLSRLMSYRYGSVIHYVAPTITWKTARGQFVLKEWKKWIQKLANE